MKGKPITQKDFILNLGDPNKEKFLFWGKDIGFNSEHSNDENTKYQRAERFY